MHKEQMTALNDFQQKMKDNIEANAHKGDWLAIPTENLLGYLEQKVREVEFALRNYYACNINVDSLSDKCVDVANIALMLQDERRYK